MDQKHNANQEARETDLQAAIDAIEETKPHLEGMSRITNKLKIMR